MKTLFNYRPGILRMLVLACFTLCLGSCTSSHLTTRASQVYLLTATQIHHAESECEFLGNVIGSSNWSYETALNELLDNAAELGATHVFVNIGRKKYLRGEAYACAYCEGPDGNPDVGYCVDARGIKDTAYCVDKQGNIVKQAGCKDASGETRKECLENCGSWVKGISKSECEAKNYNWLPRAENRQACESKGGTWLPAAKNQYTCEEIKNGKWVLDKDVIRFLQQTEENSN